MMYFWGKASVVTPCSAAVRPEACSDPEYYTKIAGYVEVAREMYGADYNPSQHDLDPEVVIRAGGGKKHGRYYMGEGTIGLTTTPNLAQIRARSTRSSASIHTRPEPARPEMKALAEELYTVEQMKQCILQDMEQFIPHCVQQCIEDMQPQIQAAMKAQCDYFLVCFTHMLVS